MPGAGCMPMWAGAASNPAAPLTAPVQSQRFGSIVLNASPCFVIFFFSLGGHGPGRSFCDAIIGMDLEQWTLCVDGVGCTCQLLSGHLHVQQRRSFFRTCTPSSNPHQVYDLTVCSLAIVCSNISDQRSAGWFSDEGIKWNHPQIIYGVLGLQQKQREDDVLMSNDRLHTE